MSTNSIWNNSLAIPPKCFYCGYCEQFLTSTIGYYGSLRTQDQSREYIYICNHCSNPTFFSSEGKQTPGPVYGKMVNDIPVKEVESLYNEARNCMSCNAYTASVLCSRKVLMKIAISRGAKEGQNFIDYVEFISEKGFVAEGGKKWVDRIKTKGSEATHEITIMGKKDAEELIDFIEMLLRFIYEFPAIIKKEGLPGIKIP